MTPLPFGLTRNVLARTHALTGNEGRVPSTLPGWEGKCFFTASGAIGAGFTQLSCELQGSKKGIVDTDREEWFLYVLEGEGKCGSHTLAAGGYAYFPPNTHFEFVGLASLTRLLVFRKTWEPYPGITHTLPEFYGKEADVPEEPFNGDAQARLKELLPEDGSDMAVNIFTFDPGATLPSVEMHVMEHGMFFLEGRGVYRLDQDWYPVQAGDALWIAPYCPQWFIAAGPRPARYIYYKNVNRMPS